MTQNILKIAQLATLLYAMARELKLPWLAERIPALEIVYKLLE